jgi:hypothetical protein
MRRKRKRRVKSKDLCSCGHFNCDPMMASGSPAHQKIQKRLREGLCMGCGKKEIEGQCGCKRKGPEDWSIKVSNEK